MKVKLFFRLSFIIILFALAFIPLKAFAVSGTYSINVTHTSLPHGGSGTLTASVSYPESATPGSVYLEITYTSGLKYSGIIGLGAGNPGGSASGTGTYTVKDTATENQTIYWTADTNYDGIPNHYSGQFSITVEHSYGDGVVVPPTCMEQGYTEYTCTICGATKRDSYTDAAGHSYVDTVVLPTCTEQGYTVHTCSVCGDTYTDSYVDALGHTYEDTVVPPTCTEQGYTVHTCSVCGDTYTDSYVDALGHDPGEWEVTVKPTNKKTGEQVLRCTRCGEILETEIIPVLSEIWPDNTACSMGARFRDEFPGLTDKWYMYTPVDLTQDGALDVPLLASNVYIIGTVHITVQDGNVSATYEVTADKVKVKDTFMTFLPSLDGLETVDPESMVDQSLPFGSLVSIEDFLGGAEQVYFFMRLVITYDIYADGVSRWYSSR